MTDCTCTGAADAIYERDRKGIRSAERLCHVLHDAATGGTLRGLHYDFGHRLRTAHDRQLAGLLFPLFSSTLSTPLSSHVP